MTHIEGEIVIAAPQERVFDMVADERNEPRYNPRIAHAEKITAGEVGLGSRYLAEPKGMGPRGVMTVETVGYDPPRRLTSSIRSSYMDVDGTLTLDPVDGGTRLRWSWEMRLRGPMRLATPVLHLVGPRWERRNWVGLKAYLENGAPA